LHPIVLPLLLSQIKVFVAPLELIEVLVAILMTIHSLGLSPVTWRKCLYNKHQAHQETPMHRPRIERNADDWVVVLVSALYGASALYGQDISLGFGELEIIYFPHMLEKLVPG